MADGPIRYCFTDHRLTHVVLLEADGSCDTPGCHWTSTMVPLKGADIKAGMSLADFHDACGLFMIADTIRAALNTKEDA